MDLEIYDTKEKKKELVRLRLEQTDYGEIKIYAADVNGNKYNNGNLGAITKGGRFRRSYTINPDLGFDLDAEGRINLTS